MSKVQSRIANDFCPQALYLYGTKQEDGQPHFGLFCWFSYCHTKDGFGVMACIGEEKLTKDLIRKNGVFSANLVTQPLLPLADYYGNVNGRNTANKMKRLPTVEWGQVLDVPTVAESPVSFELEVVQEIPMGDGSDVFLCLIRNVMIEESLLDRKIPFIDRLQNVAPAVLTVAEYNYVSINGGTLGKWGEPMRLLQECE